MRRTSKDKKRRIKKYSRFYTGLDADETFELEKYRNNQGIVSYQSLNELDWAKHYVGVDINKHDKNSNGAVHMVSAYDELPRTPANFVALSPLRYLERAAYIYPNQAAIIHGERQITWQQT